MTNGRLLLSFVYQHLQKKFNQLVLQRPHHTTRKVRWPNQPLLRQPLQSHRMIIIKVRWVYIYIYITFILWPLYFQGVTT
jgi:hypothetical protein